MWDILLQQGFSIIALYTSILRRKEISVCTCFSIFFTQSFSYSNCTGQGIYLFAHFQRTFSEISAYYLRNDYQLMPLSLLLWWHLKIMGEFCTAGNFPAVLSTHDSSVRCIYKIRWRIRIVCGMLMRVKDLTCDDSACEGSVVTVSSQLLSEYLCGCALAL